MPFLPLTLRPGVNVEATPALNSGGVSSCNLIRFKAGLPQKLGGWTKFFQFVVSGIPRSLLGWKDLGGTSRLAVGTTSQLSTIANGTLIDITPQSNTTNTAPNFSTTISSPIVTIVDPGISNVTTFDAIFLNTPVKVGGLLLHGVYQITSIVGATSYQIIAALNATASVTSVGSVPSFATVSGSQNVTVTLVAHGLVAGNSITFPASTAVGGVTISGTYVVQSVPTSDTFVISVGSLATSSTSAAMNGGLAQIVYYISLGPQAAGIGFGLGPFGGGGFGQGVVPSSQSGASISAQNWSLDNWGETLIACPRNGGIYAWTPGSGYTTALFIATAPTFNGGAFVAMPELILVCWGSTTAAPGGADFLSSPEERDPLIVRWSDALDYTNFAVTTETQAGSFHLASGSEIIGGMQGPQQALIWTDIDVWAMQYLGPPLVFGFNKLSSGCGLIAQHAATVMRGVVAWMSLGSFFMLSGGSVQEIPCTVWDAVFQDLDIDNAGKITAAANSEFSEFAWYFPSISGGTGEPDKYVKVNIGENFVWDYGYLPRSAWIDRSVLGRSIGASPQGVLYQHETSPDADGAPLDSYFETGWFTISEGRDFAFVDIFHPDMRFGGLSSAQTANVSVTIFATDYPNGAFRTYGPYNITAATNYVNTRLRGRLIKIRIESSDIGSFWRLGNMRYRAQMDGRR